MRGGPSTYWPTLGRESWTGTPWGVWVGIWFSSRLYYPFGKGPGQHIIRCLKNKKCENELDDFTSSYFLDQQILCESLIKKFEIFIWLPRFMRIGALRRVYQKLTKTSNFCFAQNVIWRLKRQSSEEFRLPEKNMFRHRKNQILRLHCGSPNSSIEVVHSPRSQSPVHFDIRNI